MNIQSKRNNRFNSGENQLGALNTIGWLADQPEDFRAWAADVGQVRSVDAGQFVYLSGDDPDGIYGLRSGALEVEFPLIGDEPVALLRATEGFWSGDSGLLSPQTRLVSMFAVEDSSLVLLPASAIRHLLNDAPRHWQSFYDLSQRTLGTAISLLAETLALTVRARACRRLLELSENRFEAHTTQDALAKMLGVARPTLRRSLNSLAEIGAIELKYRRVVILDRSLLSRFQDEQ